MNKELSYTLIIIPLLAGCTLIGSKLGEEVDGSSFGDPKDEHKYEIQYITKGLEADIEIIKFIPGPANTNSIVTVTAKEPSIQAREAQFGHSK